MDASPELAATALSVTNVARIYGEGRGVEDVTFSTPRASITAFVGVNGAGKSTTLRCIMGLIRPDRGAITLFGERAGPAQRRRIGFLPEERGLNPRERARDAIAFHAELRGWPRTRALSTADRLLERIGLGGRTDARIGQLSKGNAQRVQLLCALVHEPELLLLDEPLSGLDPISQMEVNALLREFRARGGAVLFSTHAIASAEQLCDRVVMLAGGRTAFEGSVAEAGLRAPHGAVITTVDGAALAGVAKRLGGAAYPIGGTSSAPGGCTQWRVVAPPEVSHATLWEATAAHGVTVLTFEPIRPNLEAAFWALAGGPGAGAATA